MIAGPPAAIIRHRGGVGRVVEHRNAAHVELGRRVGAGAGVDVAVGLSGGVRGGQRVHRGIIVVDASFLLPVIDVHG